MANNSQLVASDGFTLLEVILLLAVLVSMTGTVLMLFKTSTVLEKCVSGSGNSNNMLQSMITSLANQADAERVDQAKLAMNNIRTALQLYRMHMKSYPSNDQGLQALLENPGDKRWRGPYLYSEIKIFDPWDIQIEYQRDGRNYKLISAGPDQEIGTGDDIVYPEEGA